MEKYTGIWLDHQKAIIITIVGESESRHTIHSALQSRPRTPGEGKQTTRMGHAYLSAEHRQAERQKHQLTEYYHEIIAFVQEATDIFILGPGAAKTELEKMMHREKSLADKVRQVEAADRLTENQVAARVREFTAKRRSFRHPLAHPYS